jgi:hypothetical protein
MIALHLGPTPHTCLKRDLGLARHIGGQVDHDRRFLELHALAHQARGHIHLFADNAVLAPQRRTKHAAVAVAGGDAARAVEPDDLKLFLEAHREEHSARSVVLRIGNRDGVETRK